MPLSPGVRFGPYEIVAPLGSGGMGEVYRARDTRLERTVAIKVLPTSLAADPQFRVRFDREARTISQLDHPHICALHDVGEQDGVAYLVMQYLEGETLAARLSRLAADRPTGGLPFEQALTLAIEIAGALNAAHRAGVIHRDLKPGNVMLTNAGAKLLDFGIAKSQAAPVAGSGLSMLPTTPPSLTAQGAIVGTLQYMAPEQLEGKEADARTDIFAFGALVHEMLTGRKAFEGKSTAGLIAAILEHEPMPASSVQTLAGPALDRLVRTCLAKDPDDRWQSTGDLLRELKWIAQGRSAMVRSDEVATSRRTAWWSNATLAWGVAAIAALAAAAGGVAFWTARPSPSPLIQPSVKSNLTLPDNARLVVDGLGALAISPRGTHVVLVAQRDGVPRLYLRQLDTFDAKVIPGTEGAMSPFFSPDGQWVGFGAEGKLKKVSIAGGLPVVLADAPVIMGGTWGPDGTIVYAPTDVGMYRVSSAGGPATPATTLDGPAGEGGHLWPEFLPDGKSILFTVGTTGTNMERARIVLHSLTTGSRRTLIQGGTHARYVSSGHIVYATAGTLMAAPFDLATGTVTGTGVPVLEGVAQSSTGASHFSVAASGALVFAPGVVQIPTRSLVWLDRTGAETRLPLPSRPYWPPQLSPDGKHIAVGIEGPTHDIWISEVGRDTLTRVTYGSDNFLPVWTPDSTRIAFQSNRSGAWNIFWTPVDRSTPPELLVASGSVSVASSFSADGRTLVYFQMGAHTSGDLWFVPVSGSRTAKPFLQTPAIEMMASVSPDGRWIAYQSNESGRDEVYVQRFPDGGRVRQISKTGGVAPRWSARELFYVTGTALAVVDVQGGPEAVFGTPRDLFKLSFPVLGPTFPFDVTADGKRFLTAREDAHEPGPTQVNIVQGWFEELRRRTSAK